MQIQIRIRPRIYTYRNEGIPTQHGDRKKNTKTKGNKKTNKNIKKKKDADANKTVMHMLTQILIVIL